jgi:hypothetical protein
MSMATSYNYQSNVGSSLVKVKDPSLIKQLKSHKV